ncbi:hypothetical protein UFOVP157_28 [uncultured Caudovirales phage]|uniref:Uncharacterized protein n=1 Tax=uncultured Caudovirales phage TaxID=2100421 RepID=A0A6J7W902_9CAUD|nr:hypothetical protein UFOVP157_28 [uncultured Caudovirales phage]
MLTLVLLNPVMKTNTTKQKSVTANVLNAIASKDGGYSLLSMAGKKLDIYPQRIDSDYSGRGMYGDICTAFVIEEGSEAEALALQVSKLSSDAGKRVRVYFHSMGLSFVVYCPSLAIEDASE